MKHTVSNTYVLKWQLSFATEYKFTDSGLCFNTKTGNQIRKILNGRSVGYCIRGKFKALSSLRKELEVIENIKCPF